MKQLYTFIIFIITFSINITVAQNGRADLYIRQDTVWSDTIMLNSNVFIDSNVTLTILPGTFINITGYYAIFNKGIINATGTLYDSIEFTHLDTILHSDTTTTKGGWRGLRFLPRLANDTSVFKFCKIMNGKNVRVTSNDTTVSGDMNGYGGNLYGNGFGSIIFEHCYISNGIASQNGGGIYLINGNYVLIDSSHFKLNHSYEFGGGACIKYVDSLFVKNNLFNYNTAFWNIPGWRGGEGGAISIHNSLDYNAYAIVCNNRMFNNYTGVGVLYDAYYKADVSNNLICNNYGTGIWNAHLFNYPIYSNNTIANNTGYGWSGIWTESDHITLINNIIWNNRIGPYNEIGDQIYWDNNDAPVVLFSDVMLGYEGEGNIDVNPMFVNPTESFGIEYDALEADWSLRDDSPLINAGVPDTTGWNIPATDFAGNPRVYGIRIDMGAIENQNVLVSVNENSVNSSNAFLFPNPGRYYVKIHLPENSNNAVLFLTDVSGRNILSAPVTNQNKIDVSNLISGIYFYRIVVNGNIVKTGKWIKQ